MKPKYSMKNIQSVTIASSNQKTSNYREMPKLITQQNTKNFPLSPKKEFPQTDKHPKTLHHHK